MVSRQSFNPQSYREEPFKGECKRSNCRFRHLTPMQYDIEMSDYFEREQRMIHSNGGQQSDFPEYDYERRQQIRFVFQLMNND